LKQRGFSLIEIAIGLMIIGLIAASMIASVTQQNEQRRIAETKMSLNLARDAVMAFVTGQGRLPCPATAVSNGQEAIASNVGGVVTCMLEAGFLPAVTLGLPGIDPQGFLNNPWADGTNGAGTFPRAFRYAVTNLTAPVANAFTSPGLGAPGSASRRSDVQTALAAGAGLFVCASATALNVGANRCGSVANLLSNNAAVIIWTLAANGNDTTSFSVDEQQNANLMVARVLISRGYAPNGAVGGQFDDLVTWIPGALIMDRLLTSGAVQ
jgi:prepilin-type N-terminal cleavage/methylation domain-containing protein